MLTKLSPIEYYKVHDELITRPCTNTIYTIHDKLLVDYGYHNDCNTSYCLENDIPVIQYNRGGGCIVNCPGNITLTYTREFCEGNWIVVNILKDFTDFLRGKNINAVFDRNDIMVDGYKVASGVCRNLSPNYKWQIGGLQISLNQNLDVIKHVCQKKMLKVPKGLSEFGLTTQEIEEWIKKDLIK